MKRTQNFNFIVIDFLKKNLKIIKIEKKKLCSIFMGVFIGLAFNFE